MLEHLNANCRKVIVVAQEAARMFGQSSIETDHLLLAILHTDSSAANLLEAAGATLQVVHSLVQPTGKPAENRGLIKFSPSTKQVLFQSWREALQRGERHIGAEHILLAITKASSSPGATILADFGLNHQTLQQVIPLGASAP
jgi:ATP-dependent Clp protease ATP-binding subunit ClpC